MKRALLLTAIAGSAGMWAVNSHSLTLTESPTGVAASMMPASNLTATRSADGMSTENVVAADAPKTMDDSQVIPASASQVVADNSAPSEPTGEAAAETISTDGRDTDAPRVAMTSRGAEQRLADLTNQPPAENENPTPATASGPYDFELDDLALHLSDLRHRLQQEQARTKSEISTVSHTDREEQTK